MPMFPLGMVLFPGVYLPLHVFEPRYRELVGLCLAGIPEFGVVLIERGSDVGGGDARFDVGCIARIVTAAQLDDGRWVLETVGTRRVCVTRWLSDDPYPRAEVDDWDDPPASASTEKRRGEIEATLRRVLAMAAEMGEDVVDATVAIDDEPVLAGYQMAASAPLGPLDQQSLLEAETTDARLEVLGRLLDEEEAVLARRLAGG
jgi:Lon protease-like protein